MKQFMKNKIIDIKLFSYYQGTYHDYQRYSLDKQGRDNSRVKNLRHGAVRCMHLKNASFSISNHIGSYVLYILALPLVRETRPTVFFFAFPEGSIPCLSQYHFG